METDLFDFAYVPDWYEQLEELKGMVLPEPWQFKRSAAETKNQDTPKNVVPQLIININCEVYRCLIKTIFIR